MSDELYYFNEDAQEQLQMMESALLDAMDKGSNEEYVGTIFRAMHTIKGVAGMFNFEEIISFTHIAENLMDAVRNGKIELDENLLMLLLQCKDHVASLIEHAVASEAIPEDVLQNDKDLTTLIKHYLDAPLQENTQIDTQTKKAAASSKAGWHISLVLKEGFFETGMDLLSILSFLKKLGDITAIRPTVEKIPLLTEIDPFHAYMAFEIDFDSEVNEDEVREVFEFVEDDIELQISAKEQIDSESSDITVEREVVEQASKEVQKVPVAKESRTQPKKELHPNQVKHAVQSLRVDSGKIDLLIDTISEMVIANAKISRFVDYYADAELEEVSLHFESLLEELRNNVMNIRMVPVGDSFEKFRRVVNDLAHKLDKKIDFKIIGGETELDKTVIEKIADPLVHMLRNAIDHGVEMPEKRLELGKSEIGNVELRAYPESGAIVIEIEDDGKGLNKDKLIEKARSKGLIGETQELSDAEAFKLIFAPGFSTAEVVSDISGRGVGMDVVKKNIDALKGDVEVTSQEGKGSCFTIRLPLTLAIIDGFLLQVGATRYVIPLDMVSEVIEYTQKHRINMLESNLLDLRGRLLPLLNIRDFYNEDECCDCERQNIVIVQYGRYKMGLLVDELYGEYQTVIKPLGQLFRNAPGLYGASILGSGEVALIFDIPALFEILNINQTMKE